MDTCRNEQKIVDVHSADELLGEYINSLLSVHRERTIGCEAEHHQAEYIIRFLLPAIVYRMRRLRRSVLTANEVYKAVRSSFNMLTQKSFLRSFPQYVGRSKLIKGQAKTPEEWFNNAVSIMLCDKFTLLYCDGYGNYMLSHQNFYDYFIREYNIKNKKLSTLKIKLALPYMAAVCLVIALFTFTFIKMAAQITVSYPRTLQQKYITENAMTAAAESLGRLGVLIKNDTAVLDSYTEGYKEFINVYTRNRSVNNTLVSNELYTEDKSRQFVPPGSPVPLGILSDLLNSTKDYNTWSCIMFENLNTVLSDESKYPQKDRLDIIALYKQYTEVHPVRVFFLHCSMAVLQAPFLYSTGLCNF
jgi:hypothetical protein